MMKIIFKIFKLLLTFLYMWKVYIFVAIWNYNHLWGGIERGTERTNLIIISKSKKEKWEFEVLEHILCDKLKENNRECTHKYNVFYSKP